MTWNEETRILKADPGKWITNGITYAIEAKLAPGDDVSNWWEVDELPPEPENKKENGTENENDYLANEYINTEPEE